MRTAIGMGLSACGMLLALGVVGGPCRLDAAGVTAAVTADAESGSSTSVVGGAVSGLAPEAVPAVVSGVPSVVSGVVIAPRGLAVQPPRVVSGMLAGALADADDDGSAAAKAKVQNKGADEGKGKDKDPVRAALSEASTAKREAQKLQGEARADALRAVAARYSEIAVSPEYSGAGRAEAAFRAGEVLRAQQYLDEAEVMFQHATELGSPAEGGHEMAARGLLERAHIKRRAGDVPGAMTLYGEVLQRFADEKRSAAHATTWLGKLQLQSGQRELGVAALRGFAAQFPEYPTEAVRNADLVALDQLEAGDEEAARQTVSAIQAAMQSVIAGGGKQAEAVQHALSNLRVTELLSGY